MRVDLVLLLCVALAVGAGFAAGGWMLAYNVGGLALIGYLVATLLIPRRGRDARREAKLQSARTPRRRSSAGRALHS